MSSRLRLSILAFVVLLALALPAAGQEKWSKRDIEIRPLRAPTGQTKHGYMEYAFNVANKSEEARRVTITLPFHNMPGYGDHIRSISRTVQVGPGETALLALYQPTAPALVGEYAKVSIDGDDEEQPIRISLVSGSVSRSFGGSRRPAVGIGMGNSGGPVILLSQAVDRDQFAKHASWGVHGAPGMFPPGGQPPNPKPFPPGGGPAGMGIHPGGGFGGWINGSFERSVAPVETWSGSWLAYSGYDGVVVTAAELKRMPDATRTALWQYAETGGTLLVLGKGDVPAGWRVSWKDEGDQFRVYEPGFGACLVTARADYQQWNHEVWSSLNYSWSRSKSTWDARYTIVEANNRFAVVDDIGIPVRGLFLMMLAFAVVIGPVNLAILSRWKRRIWMLWTVPIVSALTCAAVFGYMVFSEGWSGHLRTDAVTVLDQTTHRAATVGWTGFYTPLTPGDGLRFGYNTELTLQGMDHEEDYLYRRRDRAGNRSCSLDWTDGQHLTQGWVTARVPAHFRLRKSESRRERVDVRREADGSLVIVNALGADITKLWLADENGKLYKAEAVAAGAEAKLIPTGEDLAAVNPDQRRTLREFYGGRWLDNMRGMRTSPENYLLPLTYIADVEGSPFVEDGLDAGNRKGRALVVGILSEIANGS